MSDGHFVFPARILNGDAMMRLQGTAFCHEYSQISFMKSDGGPDSICCCSETWNSIRNRAENRMSTDAAEQVIRIRKDCVNLPPATGQTRML